MTDQTSHKSHIPVRFTNVSFRYHTAPVLHDVNMDFGAGCIHCIVGPNGSGKSTLAGLLIGMLSPQSGDVQINGQSLPTISHHQRSRLVALTPQRILCPFDYSVLEFVRMARHQSWLDMQGVESISGDKVLQQALQTTGVVHLIGRPFNELSAGEQQRVAIARMLAQDTPITVLDEPTSALDIEHQLELVAMVQAIRQKGGCVIWITHDLHMALRTADNIVMLKNGQVVIAGPPEVALADAVLGEVFGVRRGGLQQPQFELYSKTN